MPWVEDDERLDGTTANELGDFEAELVETDGMSNR